VSKTVGILLFPDMEELDFVGPHEVLGAFAKYVDKDWDVVTVAQTAGPVRGAKGLVVVPDCSFENCPPLDVIVVPGGQGTRVEVDNKALIEFVQRTGNEATWVTSVCTGAFILSRAGFLRGRRATTYWAVHDQLRAEPDIGEVVKERFVHDGNVITAAGVSAGIDMALYLVAQLKDVEAARLTQKLIEYYPEPPFAEEAAIAVGKETN
jgi:transcriptional regulator GlxA family with amidase domain